MVCPNLKRKAQKKDDGDGGEDDYRELYEECRRDVEKLDAKVVF